MTKRMAAIAAAFTVISLYFPAVAFRAQAAAPTATDAESKQGLPSNPKAAQPDAGHDNGSGASIEGFDDILPPLSITEASLEDVLVRIKDGLPGFNAIVLREPGVPSDYPKLRNLNVNHITLSQFMVFLDKSFGCLNVTLIPGQGTSGLWVIHVREDQGSQDAKASATAKAGDPMAPPEANANHVSVFPLREVIPEIASHQNDEKYTQKQAMDDILSLLQAALKAEASGTPAEIQVHEATEMLVVKGSAAQVQLVAETLGAFADRSGKEDSGAATAIRPRERGRAAELAV